MSKTNRKLGKASIVIPPKCAPGDIVYVVPTFENSMNIIEERKIDGIMNYGYGWEYLSIELDYKKKGYRSKSYNMVDDMFGKSVFVSLGALKDKLKEMKKNGIEISNAANYLD